MAAPVHQVATPEHQFDAPVCEAVVPVQEISAPEQETSAQVHEFLSHAHAFSDGQPRAVAPSVAEDAEQVMRISPDTIPASNRWAAGASVHHLPCRLPDFGCGAGVGAESQRSKSRHHGNVEWSVTRAHTTPMENWLISPAGQKYLANFQKPARGSIRIGTACGDVPQRRCTRWWGH